MITSASNKQIKRVISLLKKAKARKEEQLFVVEGIRMVSEVPENRLRELYVSESLYHNRMNEKNQELFEKISGIRYEVVEDSVFRHMSDTMTPQGILALVKQSETTFSDILKQAFNKSKNPCFLVLENIQDPGNLGTILRTSEAAGVSGVILSQNTVDIYNPKVIRSTMGTVFRVPFVIVPDLKETILTMKQEKIQVYAAHLKGEHNFYEENYQTPTAFLIGNEGNGLTEETAQLADRYIKIPMEGQVESLNASVAASLFAYEAKRQRDMIR